jgi:hypothetical protein
LNPWVISAIAVGTAIAWVERKSGIGWIKKHLRKSDSSSEETDTDEDRGLLL